MPPGALPSDPPPSVSASFYSRRGPLGLPKHHPPRKPLDRAPPTGRWDLANPERSSPLQRHALRTEALRHLWEARHDGGSACGHPSPPPSSAPSHRAGWRLLPRVRLGRGRCGSLPPSARVPRWPAVLAYCTRFFRSHSETLGLENSPNSGSTCGIG